MITAIRAWQLLFTADYRWISRSEVSLAMKKSLWFVSSNNSVLVFLPHPLTDPPEICFNQRTQYLQPFTRILIPPPIGFNLAALPFVCAINYFLGSGPLFPDRRARGKSPPPPLPPHAPTSCPVANHCATSLAPRGSFICCKLHCGVFPPLLPAPSDSHRKERHPIRDH